CVCSILSHSRSDYVCALSLHDALPISLSISGKAATGCGAGARTTVPPAASAPRIPGELIGKLWATGSAAMKTVSSSTPHTSLLRSEEHTSELQSRFDLVCRLLLEKKKN